MNLQVQVTAQRQSGRLHVALDVRKRSCDIITRQTERQADTRGGRQTGFLIFGGDVCSLNIQNFLHIMVDQVKQTANQLSQASYLKLYRV